MENISLYKNYLEKKISKLSLLSESSDLPNQRIVKKLKNLTEKKEKLEVKENEKNNLFQSTKDIFYGNRIIFRISFSAITFSLVLIFTFFSKYMKIFGFLEIDISVIFIFATYTISGYRLALLNLILKFLIAPSFLSGYTDISLLGNFINMLTNWMFLNFYILFKFIFILFKTKSHLKKIKFTLNKFYYINYYYELKKIEILAILVFTTIFLALFISTLNTFLFNLLYFKLFRVIKSVSLVEIVEKYDGIKSFFFFINNYFAGSYSLYIAFNLINFSITSSVLVVFLSYIYKSRNA
ncbi:unknown; predicted coding region [Mycoplasmopsis pulmonis]|uniref:Uncharacterized protein n=1 Tax=Mycoplasmopsis pulmonis (strain UAB CTIP) TaxID=272635 RepID=Q98PX8_MYCPU|nr:hypothetical protein [Mycoplasmopsis pulmonis]MDZ7293607.1 hypothetical protein [Mycoplasmopsis pulmonis]CAC13764.1 unknown; predicted coding region [Mycoplasmopsis pulmonis]VEU68353.1 Uncharacterised protein [Mycoplasmopsis pulmonis]